MVDKKVTVILAGSSAGLVKSFTEASAAAEASSKGMAESFEAGTTKVGGVFGKLGQTMANWGIPFSESVTKMGEKLQEAEAEGHKFSAVMQSAGKVALGVGAAGFGVAAAEGIHLASAYQQSTASLEGSAHISAAAAKQIGDAFLDTGGKTIFSAQEQMAAYQSVAAQLATVQGHALSTAQAQEVMAASGDLAEASNTSLATTTSALAATMQSFGLKTQDAASASDVLFNASRFMNIGVDQVSQTVDKLHGRLGVAMPTLADTGALMVELGQHGITGSRGAGVVTTAMTTLLGGSKATNAELKTLGVNLFDSSGKFIGMKGAIAELAPALGKMTQAQQLAAEKTLFGSSAAQVMGQIVGDGVAKYDAASAAVTRIGSTAEAAAAQNKTLSKEVELLKSAGEDLATKLGQVLIPVIQDVATTTASVINWFEKHTTAAKILGGVVGGVLVAAIGAYVAHLAVAAARSVADFAKMVASGASWVAKTTAQFAAWVAKQTASAAESLALWSMYAAEWIAKQSAAMATWVAEQASQMATWVAMQVSQLARSAAAGLVWLGEHAAMAAGFIAQNIAMAASATAAFVAENAATLGIVAAIAALVAAIVFLATHWHQVWGDIKNWTMDAWHFIDDILHNKFVQMALAFVAPWLVVLMHWKTLWSDVKTAALDAWHFIDNNIVHPITDFFTVVWQREMTGAQTIWHTLWTGVQSTIQAVWSVIKPILDAIKAAVQDTIGLVSKVGNIAGSVGGGVVKGITSLIPHFATGGVVTSPTLAMIGEGGEPEWIVPQSKLTAMSGAVSYGLPASQGDSSQGMLGQVVALLAVLNESVNSRLADLSERIDAIAPAVNAGKPDLVRLHRQGVRVAMT